MRLQVLLSAMHLQDETYINKLNITSDVVIINQCDHNDRQESERDGRKILFLSTTDRGLSRSRNQAIDEAEAECCILCDNDVKYEPGYEKMILDAFDRNPKADILVFFIKRPERQQPVLEHEADMNYLTVMKIFSPEIAFRREKLADLRFMEQFGAGAKYAMGEENIFLYEAIRRGMKVRYIPIQIAELIETESTWFSGYTDKFFRDRGANYYAMSRRWYWLLILQFAVRKHKIYRKDNTFLHAVRVMFLGKREFKNENISDR